MFVVPDPLVVLDQQYHHLPVKISTWIEGVIMSIFMPHPRALMMAVNRQFLTIHLQRKTLVNATGKVTTTTS